jgi:hypothetical protein
MRVSIGKSLGHDQTFVRLRSMDVRLLANVLALVRSWRRIGYAFLHWVK